MYLEGQNTLQFGRREYITSKRILSHLLKVNELSKFGPSSRLNCQQITSFKGEAINLEQRSVYGGKHRHNYLVIVL